MPPYADASLSAFGETAVAADDTASLMLHGAAAFGADMYLRRRGRHMAAAGSGRGRAAGRRAALPGRGLRLRMLDSVVVFTDETVHFGQNLSDGVRAGGAAHALLADCGRAADALELVIHFLHADATAQRHAGKAGRCFVWLGQPPALPVLVNTSQMPFSS